LDSTKGRICISRDIVFDEYIFPFASIHPNASARLRAEIQLLPEFLLNPSTQFGDALVHDRHLNSPVSTDIGSSTVVLPIEKIRLQEMHSMVNNQALVLPISSVALVETAWILVLLRLTTPTNLIHNRHRIPCGSHRYLAWAHQRFPANFFTRSEWGQLSSVDSEVDMSPDQVWPLQDPARKVHLAPLLWL
jgi:hypothetical protein